MLAPGIGASFTGGEGDLFAFDNFEGFAFMAAGTLKRFAVDNAGIDVGFQFMYFTASGDPRDEGDFDTKGLAIGPRIGISIRP